MSGSNLGFISRCALIYLSLAAVLPFWATARANVTIDVGNWHLLPNTPHQPIQIYAVSDGHSPNIPPAQFGNSGGIDVTQGIDLNAEILDGTTILPGTSPLAVTRYVNGYAQVPANGLAGIGPESVAGPTVGPATLSNPDVLTGTIFAPSNEGAGVVDGVDPYLVSVETTTNNDVQVGTAPTGTVYVNGLIGTIYVDTTGITHGAWTLSLNVPDLIPTDFSGSPGVGNIVINDGLLFVPEPGSIVLALFAAAGLVAVAIRKRRNG